MEGVCMLSSTTKADVVRMYSYSKLTMCVAHRYEMQEAGVALDSAMKNFSVVHNCA